jgi:high-affinity Fe2+/Pb2+ permease
MSSPATGGILLSIAVLASFALVWGGIVMMRKPEDRQRGILMLIAAAVLFGNVLIQAWPV